MPETAAIEMYLAPFLEDGEVQGSSLPKELWESAIAEYSEIWPEDPTKPKARFFQGEFGGQVPLPLLGDRTPDLAVLDQRVDAVLLEYSKIYRANRNEKTDIVSEGAYVYYRYIKGTVTYFVSQFELHRTSPKQLWVRSFTQNTIERTFRYSLVTVVQRVN